VKRQRQGKKILSSILTSVLAVALSISFSVPVFAAGAITGSEASPAMAAIRKVLQMPSGSTTPGATFTFEFAKKSVDGFTSDEYKGTMPAITDKQVSYASTDTGTTTGDVKSVPKEVNVIISGEASAFPHAGVYEYRITEKQTGAYTINDAAKEALTYSPGAYDIRFYVKDNAAGTATYVYAIGVTVVTVDNSGQTADAKVDPTPNTGGGLVFTNTYTKFGGGGNPEIPENQILGIGEKVGGDYADRSKYFTYALTVNKASLVPGTPVYKAYVVDTTNNVVTTAANGSISNDTFGNYIAVTSGTSTTIKLKHDQRIVFTDLPIGSNYVAVETGETHYTPRVTMVVDGATSFNRTATEATDLSTGPSTANAGTVLVGEKANAASFLNTYQTIAPTGLLIGNLPFIMILLVALGAFILFIIVKSRKRREEYPARARLGAAE
jgi:hypothetical protein